MTNEEKIDQIKNFIALDGYKFILSVELKESLFSAIQALEQTELNPSYNGVKSELKPCDDCISREEAINVVHKYFVKYLKINDDICLDGIRSLPSVTPKFTDAEIQKMQELEQIQLEKAYELGNAETRTCDDAISREVVLGVIKELPNANPSYWNTCDVIDRADLIDEIGELPSVTPSYNSVKTELIEAEQLEADLRNAYDCGYNCGYADAMNDIAESEGY